MTRSQRAAVVFVGCLGAFLTMAYLGAVAIASYGGGLAIGAMR